MPHALAYAALAYAALAYECCGHTLPRVSRVSRVPRVPWSSSAIPSLPAHDDPFIARTLRIGASQVRQCVQLLAAAGHVERRSGIGFNLFSASASDRERLREPELGCFRELSGCREARRRTMPS